MNRLRVLLGLFSFVQTLATFSASFSGSLGPPFEVTLANDLHLAPQNGRLFIILSPTNRPDPRMQLGRTGIDAPEALARDITALTPGTPVVLDHTSFGFPITNFAELPAGKYFAQALFDSNNDLRSPDAPGNLYSDIRKLELDPSRSDTVKLDLNHQVPPEQLPRETELTKFVKIQSQLLTQFFGRPMFLRAGILLPRDYQRETSQCYPLWIRIGGLNTRYTSVSGLMREGSSFRKTWLADDTPRFILLQLDGAGPFGDPYQVNSANNGPYGDAITQELILYVETHFRAAGQPQSRVLSGTSTGGWVSLALQIFYPDFFNGTWSSCPDPVDFHALELVDIYQDENAYLNKFGNERPSERNLLGDVALLMRREVGVENLLAPGNAYNCSGEQWGAWTATFSPRGPDGRPVPLWDPQSGRINSSVAEQWKKYDLRIVLEKDWRRLAPKLRGKIHIAAGEADQYFLNNAVHLLDQFLSQAEPPFEGSIVYGPGKGHGWFNLSLREMLERMKAATEPAPR
jgi:S-formylglutathione hydrolase FrmB